MLSLLFPLKIDKTLMYDSAMAQLFKVISNKPLYRWGYLEARTVLGDLVSWVDEKNYWANKRHMGPTV